MANYTPNYQLHQWEPEDKFLRTDFNADNQRIDAVLKGLADQDKTLEQTLAEHSAAIAKMGNCKIYTSSYTGNGGTSRSHSFSAPPLAVFIAGPRFQLIALRPNPDVFCKEGSSLWAADAQWNGNQLVITYSSGGAGGDYKIGNQSGTTYYIVALMSA